MMNVEEDPSRALGGQSGGAGSGLLVALVAFAALNGLLYGGQEVAKRGEVAEAKALEAQLERIDDELASITGWLDQMERESDALYALGARLDEPERYYSDQATYERDLNRYNEGVDAWNHVSLPQIEVSVARHDQLVEEFNALVPQYNEVASSAYARWWLLPIPMPRGGRGVRR